MPVFASKVVIEIPAGPGYRVTKPVAEAATDGSGIRYLLRDDCFAIRPE
jgi:hypothetical protein